MNPPGDAASGIPWRAAPGFPGPRFLTAAERAADAAVHRVGLAAVLAAVLLLVRATPTPAPRTALALGLYLFGLVATFACSAAYNMAPDGPRRAVLRRLDHAAIFLMIAGTYTPVSLLAIGGRTGTLLCVVVWAGALVGVVLKLIDPARYERAAVAAYLLLGWVGIAAIGPLVQALAPWQLAALAAGGLLYSGGVVFHLAPNLRYATAIWHALVLVAAACHYALVLSLATV